MLRHWKGWEVCINLIFWWNGHRVREREQSMLASMFLDLAAGLPKTPALVFRVLLVSYSTLPASLASPHVSCLCLVIMFYLMLLLKLPFSPSPLPLCPSLLQLNLKCTANSCFQIWLLSWILVLCPQSFIFWYSPLSVGILETPCPHCP